MVNACNFIGCLFLLASLSQVYGLCSTCVGKRCHDNGECIIGCVSGYVGEYCDEACPSRCLNRRCHLDRGDGTITCSEGCEPGYCHIQCDVPCPGDCVTCDRQCGSCNVTLCNGRYYGADCSEICNLRYEKCDRETGECIICRRGYFGDECNQKCTACFTRADTIIDKCLSGCDICQSKETCPAGYHGSNCELPCSLGCKKPDPRCNRATGECFYGCVSGYHGLTCNNKCNEHCLFRRCNMATGECSTGCVQGYHGLTCANKCHEHCVSGRCNRFTGDCFAACVSGFYGMTCNYTCSEHCLSGRCNRLTGECSVGCVSGYHGLTCENICNEHCQSGRCSRATGECSVGCVSGYHGLTCNITCSEHCLSGGCNRATGECSSGCVSGYHGLTCYNKCSEHCLSGGCNRATGECSGGCVSGYHGLTCNYTCNSFCEGGLCNQHDGVCTSGCIGGYTPNLDMCEQYDIEGSHTAVAIAVPITVVGLLAGMVTAAVIWRRRRSRRANRSLTEQAEKGDEHGTTPFHYLRENGKLEHDVVLQIVNRAKGDINKQDENGITPLHVLCKESLPMKDILTLINQGDKADMYGNTPLHYLCRRQGINAEVIQQQLEQIPETNRKKQNDLGYTPLDYLTDQDNSLPWTDGMIARSAADLVVCRLKHGEDWIVVLGRAMILNSERVYGDLQVKDFGRVLTNMEQSGDSPGQFSEFWGTCSSPVPVLPSPSPLTTPPSYWETSSTLTWRERVFILLEMGLKLGRRNMDEGECVSSLPHSVCVSVTDDCRHHHDGLCIRVWRKDQKDSGRYQVGECVSLSLPTPGVEFTLTFGLVLDVGRGRVGFIDGERGQLLCKVDLQMKEEVSPMFYVIPDNRCDRRMRLVSGREICVTDRKIHLIQQALSD